MSLQAILEKLKSTYGPDIADVHKRLQELDELFKASALALKPLVADFALFLDAMRQYPEHLRGPLQDLARQGWYLDPSWTIDVPLRARTILLDEGSDSLDKTLVDHFELQAQSIVDELCKHYPSREAIIRSAYKAHLSRDYELSVPVLLIQADGISKEQFGHYLFLRQDGNPEISRYIDSLNQDDLLRAFLAPLAEPTTINFSQKERGSVFSGLNRHLVLHGDSVDYGTRVNSLKALSLLNHVGRIAPPAT